MTARIVLDERDFDAAIEDLIHGTESRFLIGAIAGVREYVRSLHEERGKLQADVEQLNRDPYVESCDESEELAAANLRIKELEAQLVSCRVHHEGREMADKHLLQDLVKAMTLWGSWEDGVPEAGPGEFGSVGIAFDRACSRLGLVRECLTAEVRP